MDQKKNAPGKAWGYLVKILGKKKEDLTYSMHWNKIPYVLQCLCKNT